MRLLYVVVLLVASARISEAVFGSFDFIEVDYLNQKVSLSPVHRMFVGLFLLFLMILRVLGYTPVVTTPSLQKRPIGRSFGDDGTGGAWASIGGFVEDLPRMLEFATAMATMDPKSCFGEFVCEYEEASQFPRARNDVRTSSRTGARHRRSPDVFRDEGDESSVGTMDPPETDRASTPSTEAPNGDVADDIRTRGGEKERFGTPMTCATKYEKCPLSFKGIARLFAGGKN